MAIIEVVTQTAVAIWLAWAMAAPQAPYTGKPFNGQPQKIPGRVQAEFYDVDGEGVAYHDSDAVNSGSGMLNQGDSDLDRFRKGEAVDISYTKPGIDKTVEGEDEKSGELYLGWTSPGEWVTYTVEVEQTGAYIVKGHLSSRFDDAVICLAFDGIDKTGPIAIPTGTSGGTRITWLR